MDQLFYVTRKVSALVIAVISSLSYSQLKASEKTDSLIPLLNSCHDSLKYSVLSEIADEFYYEGILDESINYYNLAVEHEKTRTNPDQRRLAKALSNIGYCHFEAARYQQAIEFYNNAYTLSIQAGDSLEISDICLNLGNSWFYMGGYEKSIHYFRRALEIDTRLNKKEYMGINLSNLGKVFEAWKQSEKAIDFYRQALSISLELQDSNSMAIRMSNIGTSYLSLQKFDSAFQYLSKAYEIDSVRKNTGRLAARLDLIGVLYQRQEKYDLAQQYFSKALTSVNDKNQASSKAIILSNWGKNSLYMGQWDKAEEYLTSGLKLASEFGLAHTILNNYQALSELNKKRANFEKSLHYLELYSKLRDSVFSTQSQKSINEFQVLYETEKKDAAITLLNQQQKIQEIQLKSYQQQHYFYLILAFMLLSLSFVLYILFRNKQISGRLLSEKNEELRKLNNTKDRFISILAHDLRNPFSAFVNIASALDQNYTQIPETDKKEFIGKLNQSAQSMNILLKNLLEWATIQKSGKPENVSEISLKQLTDETIQSLLNFAEGRKIELLNRIPAEMCIISNKAYLSTIINNLTTNAIKFSHPENKVEIQAYISNENVHLHVQDFGIGMHPHEISQLFRIDAEVQTIGSHKNKGSGLGLILCKEIIDKMSGKISVESKPGEGSKFIVTLPLKSN